METSLLYGLDAKQLTFKMRERVTTDPDVALAFKGFLNTSTGAFEYRGTLKKHLSAGPATKGDASQPLRLGAGVGIASATRDEPFLTLSAEKRLALLEGPDTMLTAKARVDYDPRGGKVRLSLLFFLLW